MRKPWLVCEFHEAERYLKTFISNMAVLFVVQVFTDNEIRPGEKRISCMLFDAKHDRLITGMYCKMRALQCKAYQKIEQTPKICYLKELKQHISFDHRKKAVKNWRPGQSLCTKENEGEVSLELTRFYSAVVLNLR